MPLTLGLVYNSNAVMPKPAGDLMSALFTVDGLAAEAYPGAAGDPVDFSPWFGRVFGCALIQFGGLPGAGVWPNELIVPAYDPVTLNTGVFRFFRTGAVVSTPLENLPAANYPWDFRMRVLVVGNPITDAGLVP